MVVIVSCDRSNGFDYAGGPIEIHRLYLVWLQFHSGERHAIEQIG
jgi:hypothetical protein